MRVVERLAGKTDYVSRAGGSREWADTEGVEMSLDAARKSARATCDVKFPW
jgi:hypothetical protein